MSLRVWLPLNGDLKNQGLDELNLSKTSGATFDSDGKIGKCLNIGTTGGAVGTGLNFQLGLNYSISYWVKFNSFLEGWNNMFCFDYDGNHYQGMCYNMTREGNIGWHIRTDVNGTPENIYDDYGAFLDLTANRWYHITLTLQNGLNTKLYLNGELKKSGTLTTIFSNPIYTYFVLGSKSIDAQWSDCKLNDFRIYDHCLSQKEVKEISKGLVFHCPLNDNNVEEMFVYDTSGYGHNMKKMQANIIPKEKVAFMGSNQDLIQTDTGVRFSVSAAYDGIGIDPSILEPNTEYTYSYRIKKNSGTLQNIGGHLGSNIKATSFIIDGEELINKGYDPWANPAPLPDDTKYHYVSYSFTTGSNMKLDSNTNGVYIQPNRTLTVSANVIVEAVKLEKGIKPTPWCESQYIAAVIPQYIDLEPFKLDSNAYSIEIVYDDSLNQPSIVLDPTTLEEFEWEKDTTSRRYQDCLKFNGEKNMLGNSEFQFKPIDEFTYSVWVYSDIEPTSNQHILSTMKGRDTCLAYVAGEGFVISTYEAESNLNIHTYTPWVSGWHMITGTLKAGDKQKIYLDGELMAETSFRTPSWTVDSTNSPAAGYAPLYIGAFPEYTSVLKQTFKGSISDARIYATALSAEDIKELYNTSAFIDNNGNDYAYEFIEDYEDFSKVDKNGVWNSRMISEYKDPVDDILVSIPTQKADMSKIHKSRTLEATNFYEI